MIQPEGDAATVYEGAQAADKKGGHTRLLPVDNESPHGIYIDGLSPCVEKIADSFVCAGKVPNADSTCTTNRRWSTPEGGVSPERSAQRAQLRRSMGRPPWACNLGAGSNLLLRAPRERTAQLG